VWSVALSYDLINRITNKIETVGGVTRTLGYAYDVSGRLKEVWQDGALVTTYTYDANGNRLSRNLESATYDAQDRVQTYAGDSCGWSLNGDLRTRTSGGQTTSFTYDVRGSLVSVTQPVGPPITYLNDAAGRRIGKQSGGTLQRGWLWDGDQPVAELDANGAVALRFVYAADDQTPSFLIKGANTYRILSDERGSVRLVVNVADGSIIQQLDYDEFGRVLVDTAPGFQPFAYAGGLYDSDTGLVRFGARDYSAETGQWAARDPIAFEGGQFSLYAYTDNDPINRFDPSGTGPFRGEPAKPQAPGQPPGPYLPNQVARLYEIAGGPVYVNRAGRIFKAKKDEKLFVGDKISTKQSSGGVAALELMIGGRVGIKRDTEVQLVNVGEVQDVDGDRLRQIVLKSGGVWAKFTKAERPLTIQTRGGVLGGIKG